VPAKIHHDDHPAPPISDRAGARTAFRPGCDGLQRDAADAFSQPFWPAYLTAERIARAQKLKLAITAGIGPDHVDLRAAIEKGVTVAEVTYSNSISVSEHVVMMILSLVRNYIPSYKWVIDGLGDILIGSGPLRRRDPRNPRMLGSKVAKSARNI
jgi:formate dehydrogenase